MQLLLSRKYIIDKNIQIHLRKNKKKQNDNNKKQQINNNNKQKKIFKELNPVIGLKALEGLVYIPSQASMNLSNFTSDEIIVVG